MLRETRRYALTLKTFTLEGLQSLSEKLSSAKAKLEPLANTKSDYMQKRADRETLNRISNILGTAEVESEKFFITPTGDATRAADDIQLAMTRLASSEGDVVGAEKLLDAQDPKHLGLEFSTWRDRAKRFHDQILKFAQFYQFKNRASIASENVRFGETMKNSTY